MEENPLYRTGNVTPTNELVEQEPTLGVQRPQIESLCRMLQRNREEKQKLLAMAEDLADDADKRGLAARELIRSFGAGRSPKVP